MKNLPVPLQVIAQALRDWWDDWIGQVVNALVWIFCCMTIVLGPPATLGLYYVANRLAHVPVKGLRAVARDHGFAAAQTFLAETGLDRMAEGEAS